MSLVVVDAPKVEAKNVPPTLLALTSSTLYVRFHGRNAETWNVRGRSAAERFDYLYSEDELKELIEPLRELAGQAENAYARSIAKLSAVAGKSIEQSPSPLAGAYREKLLLLDSGIHLGKV